MPQTQICPRCGYNQDAGQNATGQTLNSIGALNRGSVDGAVPAGLAAAVQAQDESAILRAGLEEIVQACAANLAGSSGLSWETAHAKLGAYASSILRLADKAQPNNKET